MRKVIDLCLDMPMGAEELSGTLSAMCLDPLYRGYKTTYGSSIAAQAGLTVEELDEVFAREGKEGFLKVVHEAAEKHAVTPAEFVRHLDEVGVEWGITCDGNHDNRKTAEIVQAFPQKFKGFVFVVPALALAGGVAGFLLRRCLYHALCIILRQILQTLSHSSR